MEITEEKLIAIKDLPICEHTTRSGGTVVYNNGKIYYIVIVGKVAFRLCEYDLKTQKLNLIKGFNGWLRALIPNKDANEIYILTTFGLYIFSLDTYKIVKVQKKGFAKYSTHLFVFDKYLLVSKAHSKRVYVFDRNSLEKVKDIHFTNLEMISTNDGNVNFYSFYDGLRYTYNKDLEYMSKNTFQSGNTGFQIESDIYYIPAKPKYKNLKEAIALESNVNDWYATVSIEVLNICDQNMNLKDNSEIIKNLSDIFGYSQKEGIIIAGKQWGELILIDKKELKEIYRYSFKSHFRLLKDYVAVDNDSNLYSTNFGGELFKVSFK